MPDAFYMLRALELAARGRGLVEPNPMVGCVIVAGGEVVGEGWHERYGEAHAEVNALRLAGSRARGATAYVTLEPCCHQGQTPPCTRALLEAGVARVVAAMSDPFAEVAGEGIAELQAAGVTVEVGLLEHESRALNAPYLKLLATGRPWVNAKWAMTLDGKTASASGDSRWISSEASRAIVHELRGRMDAIIIGRRTAEVDDPLLTARPPGARTAARIVVDTQGSLASESQLVRTAREIPTIVAVGPNASAENRGRLTDAGCKIMACHGETAAARLDALLAELGRRRWTNVLVEGGADLLGSFFDGGHVDEVHAFIAPKLLGGGEAPSPIGGHGRNLVAEACELECPTVRQVGGDTYVSGRIARKS